MLFSSLPFLLFFVIVFSIHSLLRKHSFQKIGLLFCSLFFYAFHDIRHLILLLFVIVFNFYTAKKIEDAALHFKKRIITFGVVVNLLVLGFFKYFNFFVVEMLSLFKKIGFETHTKTLDILLPIGISFYIFQAISYIVDVYRKEIVAEKNVVNFALYLSFFPQIIAGPIERYSFLNTQLQNNLTASRKQLKKGFYLLVLGLFYKVIIGDQCGKIVDAVFYDVTEYQGLELVFASLLFGVQIYADFMGYSIMARGLAQFFGIELSSNFSQPYLSFNIKEFWKRWHITLSTWLKDYLYIPLGGNKVGRTKINILLVMLIGGLWHGANWNFLIWGLYHGILLVLYAVIEKHNWNRYFSWLLTFIAVQIGWVIFRIENLAHFKQFIHQITIPSDGIVMLRFFKIWISFFVLIFALDLVQRNQKTDAIFGSIKNTYIATGLTFGLFVIAVLMLIGNQSYPFIYFQF